MSDAGFLETLSAAMDAVGTARFEKQLADAIGSVLEYDFITMARYSIADKPRFLIHSHTFPSHMAELYLSQFVDADPYIEHWRAAEEPGVVWLQDIAFAHKQYARYTEVFLPQIGVKDEIGVFLPAVGRDSVALFYNNRQRLYAPDDVQSVRRVFDVGAALYRVHIRALMQHEQSGTTVGSPSLGSPPRLTSDTGETIWLTNEWRAQQIPEILLSEGDVLCCDAPDTYNSTVAAGRTAPRMDQREWVAGLDLTPREREIVELCLTGHANARIAEVLSLSLGNVKNHKRRIYAKLDILGERDLFVRYIKAISVN